MIQEPFKDKLLNYEVSPPTDAWDAISDELVTSNDLLPVSKKLFDYQVAPPAEAWNFIVKSLSAEQELPAEPKITRWKIPVFKAVVAAAILSVLIIGGLYLSHLEMLKNKLTANEASSPNTERANSGTRATESAPVPGNIESSDVPALAIDIQKARRNSSMDGKELRNIKIQRPIFPGSELGIIIAAKPIRNANGEIIQNTQIMNHENNQYISITGPNGQQTKISSKFLHMLLFINDDSDIDQVDGYFDKNFLESLIWKSRFQDWRNKIINTSFVPSSTNFMDILELKDLITKDKQ